MTVMDAARRQRMTTELPSLTIAPLDATTFALLRQRALRQGRTIEQEALLILQDALGTRPQPQSRRGLGSRIHAHFAHPGGVDLDVTDRGELAADLERRARIAELFVSGDWGVELETFEADQERDGQQEAKTDGSAPA
jgi:plasmid stability protein